TRRAEPAATQQFEKSSPAGVSSDCNISVLFMSYKQNTLHAFRENEAGELAAAGSERPLLDQPPREGDYLLSARQQPQEAS
ncbi:MAG: hypothetical protein ABSF31_00715, partial [Steroidobacteraceae bacterium]